MGNDILPLVESMSNTEDDLQSNFQIFDTCSSKRVFLLTFFLKGNQSSSKLGYDDECKTASEMYECSRKSQPNVTSEIFKSFDADSSIVKFQLNC
jgi:hypothetical protein